MKRGGTGKTHPVCETRLNFEFTATNRMSGKNLWAEIFGPKVG